ncbi:nuclear transport factor 2 family protein [Sphingomonas solaris]|uniref:Nuclear transport factor 2 family protein n=1 Tax=Alterirhizorhabdus solaris TaxID=2529389 RepID=A0A558RB76_9SPHN|nr:nuclear transport factor 2 family protein [Sphingomonas solaris]TVV76624.1 nuclear transport factor 2 family protein [Sphingomonas solaris]
MIDDALEKKLRELVDRQEIWEVLLRYGRGVDRLDRELLRSCYHDDAIDDHHVFAGSPDGFIDWAFEDARATTVSYHHGVNNHSCELDGDDAHTETYYTYIGRNKQPPHLLSIGRYLDHFQRRDGVWKIANRVCVIEELFELTAYPYPVGEGREYAEGARAPATRDRNDPSYQRPIRPRRPIDSPR